MKRFLLFFICLALVLVLGSAIFWNFSMFQGHSEDVFLEIQRGTSTRRLAEQLEQDGIIRSRWSFIAIRLLHPRATLQAGEYKFDSPMTPSQVFDKIRRGDIFYEELTVPEGSSIFDIANLLSRMNTVGAEQFLAAARDSTMIRDLDPLAPTLEGFLFPSIYRVTHKTTAKQLCRAMTERFRREWGALGGYARAADLHRIVTLASLVEKETALPQERPLIAAVFDNRLRAGMPLQCDPSTVYAALLENRYRGTIYRSDLISLNPYNTYTHPGLPPGPIANPGRESLKAALAPADVAYLYFVAKADGTGGHQFSTELNEHEKAVQAFRKSMNGR